MEPFQQRSDCYTEERWLEDVVDIGLTKRLLATDLSEKLGLPNAMTLHDDLRRCFDVFGAIVGLLAGFQRRFNGEVVPAVLRLAEQRAAAGPPSLTQIWRSPLRLSTCRNASSCRPAAK